MSRSSWKLDQFAHIQKLGKKKCKNVLLKKAAAEEKIRKEKEEAEAIEA